VYGSNYAPVVRRGQIVLAGPTMVYGAPGDGGLLKRLFGRKKPKRQQRSLAPTRPSSYRPPSSASRPSLLQTLSAMPGISVVTRPTTSVVTRPTTSGTFTRPGQQQLLSPRRPGVSLPPIVSSGSGIMPSFGPGGSGSAALPGEGGATMRLVEEPSGEFESSDTPFHLRPSTWLGAGLLAAGALAYVYRKRLKRAVAAAKK
jgi:hypothetical protein